MKLTIFQAADGDCLLLTSRDGRHLLVDGGRTGSFRQYVAPHLAAMREQGQAIDLVCVSHIDGDHIEGILEMMNILLDWRVYDYQASRGNPRFKKPAYPRPPEIHALWHNSFHDVIGENAAPIEQQLIANASILLSVPELGKYVLLNENLANGVADSLRLADRVGSQELNIPINQPFGGRAVLAPETPASLALGSLCLFLLGPTKKDLERQRREWNRWLRDNQNTVEKIRAEAAEDEANLPMMTEGQLVMSAMREQARELGRRDLVTAPNLASIMLLVEEDGPAGKRTILLTGDGHARDILKGLEAQGKLDAQGKIHVNLLKVQHHGAEHNINEEFCQRVTADHYIFCANGASQNPDPEVLRVLVNRRNRAGTPFKLWFNSSPRLASGASNQLHMQTVEDTLKKLARRKPKWMTYQFLPGGDNFVLEV